MTNEMHSSKGTRPTALPIDQQARLKPVTKLKAEKALDTEIPGTLLTRTDRILDE